MRCYNILGIKILGRYNLFLITIIKHFRFIIKIKNVIIKLFIHLILFKLPTIN